MKLKPLLAAIIVVLAIFVGQALANAESPSRYLAIAQIAVADQSLTDGRPLLNKMMEKVQALNDYSYDCRLISFKHPKPKVMGAKFFYKKPNMIRLQVVSDDYRNGSVVARATDGTIKGCGGGLLNAMKMTLDEDSRLLKLPAGQSVINSDFISLLAQTKSAIASGSPCKASKTPMRLQTPEGPKVAFVLDVYSSASDSSLRQRLLIDPQTLLPVEWGFFKGGSLVSTTIFHNLNANQGFGDDLFQL